MITARIECPRLSACAMFNVFDSEGFIDVWKNTFCLGKFPQCRRYQLFLVGAKVPPNLLPSGEQISLPADRHPLGR